MMKPACQTVREITLDLFPIDIIHITFINELSAVKNIVGVPDTAG